MPREQVAVAELLALRADGAGGSGDRLAGAR